HAHLQPPGAEGRADAPGQHLSPGGAAALDPGGGRGGAQRAGEPLPGARRAALHAPARAHAAALQAARAAARHGAAQRRPGLAAPAAPAPARAARRALLRRRRQHLQSGALPGDANNAQGLCLAGGLGWRATLRTTLGGERQSRWLVHGLESRQALCHRHGSLLNSSSMRAVVWMARVRRTSEAGSHGFAVSLQVILSNPKAVFKRHGSQPGMQESDFLKQITTVEELEPKASNCTKVLVWHTRTEKVNLANEPKYHLDTVKIEV
uniref:Galactosylgalactosylxylosylprotein 3-beta-glucuronosyltransferase n=1 Tax=Equus caballus TaxID=9796 RepID=A0A9L0TG89_HORSE